MIFPDYPSIFFIALYASIGAGAIWGFQRVRDPSTRKWVFRLVRLPLSFISSALILITGCGIAEMEHSQPLYSPNHREAIRENDFDAGALGGWTNFTLYSRKGLLSSTIFVGEWKQAEIKTIRWVDDSHVSIFYDNSYHRAPTLCTGTRGIDVKCQPVTYGYSKSQ